MALSSKLDISYGAKLAAVIDMGTQEANLTKRISVSLANGVLAGMADRIWADTITLAASATQDIDLAGTLTDALGGPAVFARIKGLLVAANSANVNTVVVGAAAANPIVGLLGATHTVTLRPGAVFCAFAGATDLAGYVVTPGTGDLLRVANGGAGGTVTLDIAVIGCSA